MFCTSKLALCTYITEEVGTSEYDEQAVLPNFTSICLKH